MGDSTGRADAGMAAVTTSALSSSTSESTSFVILAAKHLLWLFSWLVVAFYAMVWIIMPVKNGEKFYDKINNKFEGNKQWGGPGVYILLFTGPFIVLAVVACVSLELEKAFPSRRNAVKQRSGWMRRVYDSLWTQPLVVRGPLGMMTAAEMVGLAMVIFVTLWHFWKYSLEHFKDLEAGTSEHGDPHISIKMQKFEYIALILGWVALVPFALLFLPVSRGSPILKLIDIPFEHAVKYHVWLGHMTMLLLTAHGVAYGIFYGVMNEAYLFVKWQRTGIANLPGVISLVAGLLMWPTSLAYVRRRFFNVFFNIHQLYLVFFIFAAWHLGILHISFFLGGALLFFIDRFLRFLQSRKAIRGVTARVLPTGIVELKIPLSPGYSYTPLSFMFLNVPALSRLQWHPFSTSSTPLDNSKCISIVIKPLGDWTKQLHDSIQLSTSEPNTPPHCPFALKLYAEGPYGHDSNYFLRYKHLLLVAGGVGLTPFMAIIHDILYRYQLNQANLPTTVDLIWCVKRRSEMDAFAELFCHPSKIFSSYGKTGSRFRLNVKIFLTAEHVQPAAITGSLDATSRLSHHLAIELQDKSHAPTNNGTAARHMSSTWPGMEGGSGSNLTMLACMTSAAALGLTLFMALFRVYVYHPHTDPTIEGKELAGWIDVLLFLVALVVAVVGFGGSVVCGSWLASKYLQTKAGGRNGGVSAGGEGRELDNVQKEVQIRGSVENVDVDLEEDKCVESLLEHSTIVVGTRPNFTEVMNEVRGQYSDGEGAEVGVLVCGPESLAAIVAEQCRSQNFKQLWNASPSSTQFHYHSVSFDL